MKSFSLLRHGALLAACLLPVGGAAADDRIQDPRQACEDLGRIIGEKSTDKLATTMIAGSRGMMDKNAAITGSEQINAVARLQGEFRLLEFMAEREYGDRVRRYWYLLLFDGGQPFYLHCQFVKPDDMWQLVDFDFNTDLEKVAIP